MSTSNKRLSVTLLPEWEDELDRLKKTKFYNQSKAELIRYLINLGLKEVRKTLSEKDEQSA